MWMATPYCCIIVTQIAYICMCVRYVYMYVRMCVPAFACVCITV